MKDTDFGKIFESFGQPIYRLCVARTGDTELSHDITQQVFLILYKKQPNFPDRSALRVWLIRTALKLIANERRRAEKVCTEPLDEKNGGTSLQTAEFELYDLCLSLGDTLSDVTVLYYVEDMSVEEIARALSISKSAVKSRLHRARKSLSKIYKEEIL